MEERNLVVVAAGNYGRLSVFGSNGYGTITAPGQRSLGADRRRDQEQRIDFRRCRNLSQLQFEGPNDV